MPEITVIVTEPINKMGVEYLKERDVNVIELPPGSTGEDPRGAYHRGGWTHHSRQHQNHPRTHGSSPRLKVVGVHGIGCDHVDLDAAKELGKIVCNTPDALTVTVAEMAMALTLALLRNVVSADKAVRNDQWKRKYSDLIGAELAGKKVGVIGFGRIGEATARRLQAFDAEIIYWSRTRKPESEKKYGFKWCELEELLKQSDIISLHIPATPETRHILGAKQFEMMRDGVYIINTARGKVIDEKALIDALISGKVKAAALDVFENEPLSTDSPLCGMDNVILTPHLSASNLEGMQRMAVQVAEGVLRVNQGLEPRNRVA